MIKYINKRFCYINISKKHNEILSNFKTIIKLIDSKVNNFFIKNQKITEFIYINDNILKITDIEILDMYNKIYLDIISNLELGNYPPFPSIEELKGDIENIRVCHEKYYIDKYNNELGLFNLNKKY